MENWNEIISGLPEPHIFQTWEYGLYKSITGWEISPQVWYDGQAKVEAAALILQRGLPVIWLAQSLRVMYIPKGPTLDWANAPLRRRVLDDLYTIAKKQHAIFIKIDPDVHLGTGPGDGCVREEIVERKDDPLGSEVLSDLHERNWRLSDEHITVPNTIVVNLNLPEDEMLARMKQKTRYNIHLAERKGVSIRKGTLTDLPMLYHMIIETSERDGFLLRPEWYYVKQWVQFMEAGMAIPLIAEVEGEAVAAIVLFHFGKRAWYLHGMSRSVHREKMPNALIQWEAMRLAKELGCETYDLRGAPDVFNESDRMWGLYLFKCGFGGEIVRTISSYDLPVYPLLYWMYSKVMPRLMRVARERGIIRPR